MKLSARPVSQRGPLLSSLVFKNLSTSAQSLLNADKFKEAQELVKTRLALIASDKKATGGPAPSAPMNQPPTAAFMSMSAVGPAPPMRQLSAPGPAPPMHQPPMAASMSMSAAGPAPPVHQHPMAASMSMSAAGPATSTPRPLTLLSTTLSAFRPVSGAPRTVDPRIAAPQGDNFVGQGATQPFAESKPTYKLDPTAADFVPAPLEGPKVNRTPVTMVPQPLESPVESSPQMPLPGHHMVHNQVCQTTPLDMSISQLSQHQPQSMQASPPEPMDPTQMVYSTLYTAPQTQLMQGSQPQMEQFHGFPPQMVSMQYTAPPHQTHLMQGSQQPQMSPPQMVSIQHTAPPHQTHLMQGSQPQMVPSPIGLYHPHVTHQSQPHMVYTMQYTGPTHQPQQMQRFAAQPPPHQPISEGSIEREIAQPPPPFNHDNMVGLIQAFIHTGADGDASENQSAQQLFCIVQSAIEAIVCGFEPTDRIEHPVGKIFGMLLESFLSESDQTEWVESEDVARLFEMKVAEAVEVLATPEVGMLKKLV
ncbi:MAG: hypothetical protein KVP17_005119 [Porospora cf. gigantea B]|uniref:uncharacterized protein n=1 Tax=Porospora cf. gigantea B TaxID=2853592 RepID=UPI0035717DE3|nr:MAG: hypothetical protein KVP17_005119 [Porospora cf. gigantea B]